MLDEYLSMLEQAKARDHRKIGKTWSFSLFSESWSGAPLMVTKGAMLRERLENFLRKIQVQYGYYP